MPLRQFTPGSSYRYGFNGKEDDDEVKGNGNQQDYGFRIYDPRIGKFLSVDPLAKDYPWYTPYQFSGNKPINSIDLDGLEENSRSTYVHRSFPILSNPRQGYTPPQSTGKPPMVTQDTRTPYDKIQAENAQKQRQYRQNLENATMDPLASGMIYPAANAANQYAQGTINHGVGVYKGVKEGEYGTAAKNAGLFVLDIAPFFAKGSSAAATGETYYRALSATDYATFVKTGKIPATGETFISPTRAFSEGYDGVLLEINTKVGTMKQLQSIGVRNVASGHPNITMPLIQKGWTRNNAFFKLETNASGLQQVNIGLGNGNALQIFNSNITSYKVLKVQTP